MGQSIYRQFWRYTLPTVAAMLVNGLYQIVDGIFIGHYIGADGLAGINLAWPIIGCVLGVSMMIGVGTGALVSIKQGENNNAEAKKVLASGLMMVALLSPLISLLLVEFGPSLIRSQGAQDHVYELATEYLGVLTYVSPLVLASFAMPFLLRNDNSPNLATVLMVIGAIANIVLDYIFIALLDWELLGAAIATSIAQSIVALVGLAYFFSPYATLRLSLSDFGFDPAKLVNIVGTGASSLFMYAYASIMVAMHNWMFSIHGNLLVIGAYAIVGYIITVYYLTAEGIANGMQPLVSYNYGAKRTDNIMKVLKMAMLSAVVGGILFVTLLNVFPQASVAIFNASDAQLQKYAVTGLRLHVFAIFLDGFIVVAAAYYQAVGLGRKATFVSLANIFVQFPFLFLLPKWLGVSGVWLAYPLSNIFLSIFVFVWLMKDIKRLTSQVPTQVVATSI